MIGSCHDKDEECSLEISKESKRGELTDEKSSIENSGTPINGKLGDQNVVEEKHNYESPTLENINLVNRCSSYEYNENYENMEKCQFHFKKKNQVENDPGNHNFMEKYANCALDKYENGGENVLGKDMHEKMQRDKKVIEHEETREEETQSEEGKAQGDTENKVKMKIPSVVDNEEMRTIFSVFHIGITKIEAIKALYRDYKNNFNRSLREKMSKLNSLIYFYNDNNFENHITVDYINDKDKINAIKRERIARLFLYIEDIKKLKQALKVKQHNDLELEDDEKKEYFYDANEDIEDFFIFDHTFSYLNNDVETIFTECENSSFFRDDASIDTFLEEGKNKSDQEFNMSNLFARFSLKNYYLFDINKNLCSIYDCTPMIIKKFAEKINSYNTVKTDKALNSTKPDNINFPLDPQNTENYNCYSGHSLGNNQNLDTYIQFHCEKWQENMYDIVEVNSLEFDFNRLNCNIM
ncbi:conserved Plasmodium protein, unknown function [Plasmodium ovale wallikeri]|uniref:Uncharacterized protein n=2 Tax=Plasmodium ovale TaxID=36330 RepID=A0A1A8ZVP3_PLAOA|nr:conserved Plasmodium protein, unknown function [Plasmodium ovale wallikeri]SBT47943.1 conserved Plasmodium protein, unknown function [Plasmodium ovale wallikeri]SBT73770.1 conserved Plasmodium protein, unknown function [Plasmodium ovale]